MKSYFLAPIASSGAAIAALSVVLPGQVGTWLLKDDDGDVIAYFSLIEADSTTAPVPFRPMSAAATMTATQTLFPFWRHSERR